MATINEQLDDLDQQMFNNFMAYAQAIMDSWESFSGNPGQMTIIREHILPAAQEHISNAANYWPRGASPDEYGPTIYGCYQPDVIERAFSDTIESVVGQLSEWHQEADDFQIEHERLAAIIGGVHEPHSVYPPFMGAGGLVTQRTGTGREGLPSFIQI